MLYQTSCFGRMFLIHAVTLNENNRHSFDEFGLKCTSREIHRRIHMTSNRSISLFGYPTASESGSCPWDSWNGITVARFRDRIGGKRETKVRTISWITNEGRNDIKLADFRTYNRHPSYVRCVALKRGYHRT